MYAIKLVQRNVYINYIYKLILLLYVCVPLNAQTNASHFKDFSADYIKTVYGKSDTGKIYVKKNKIRIETVRNSIPVIVIIRFDKGVVWNIMESMQFYEMKISLCKDLPHCILNKEQIKKKSTIGNTTIAGYECLGYQYLINEGQGAQVTHWYSQELHFPIKIVLEKGTITESIDECINISRKKLENELFDIPSGYSKLLLPEELESFFH